MEIIWKQAAAHVDDTKAEYMDDWNGLVVQSKIYYQITAL